MRFVRKHAAIAVFRPQSGGFVRGESGLVGWDFSLARGQDEEERRRSRKGERPADQDSRGAGGKGGQKRRPRSRRARTGRQVLMRSPVQIPILGPRLDHSSTRPANLKWEKKWSRSQRHACHAPSDSLCWTINNSSGSADLIA